MQLVSPLTIDDCERLPDELAINHELEDGKLVDVSGDIANHHSLRDELIMMLLPYVTKHELGRVICGKTTILEGMRRKRGFSTRRRERPSCFPRRAM